MCQAPVENVAQLCLRRLGARLHSYRSGEYGHRAILSIIMISPLVNSRITIWGYMQ